MINGIHHISMKCKSPEEISRVKEDAVYIGDTAGDEEAARYAGIHFIWAEYGFGKVMSPDAVLTDIGELPSLLLSIWNKKIERETNIG